MHGYSSHGRTKSGGSRGFGVGGGGGGGGGALAQPPGSVYRSPELFENLWPFMEDDSSVGGSVGGGGFIGGGYGGGQATAGERAVWVKDEAEGFVGVHGG